MFERGKLVLVPFPFTDLTAQKVRPALIVSRSRARASDVIVVFVTSRPAKRGDRTAVPLAVSPENGLKADSVLRCDKLATLDRRVVLGEIGQLSGPLLSKANRALSFALGLAWS